MEAKSKSAAYTDGKYPRKEIPCISDGRDDESIGRAYAKVLTSPAVAAHRVINAANPKNLRDVIDAPAMMAILDEEAAAVNRGDMKNVESMLMNQATALQGLFVHLTEKGLEQSHMPNLEGFMRLALRAQSQCRATLETLSAIKNPPVIYAKQVNQTTGPQQINNGITEQSQAQGFDYEQNKQSGPELLPDTRASQVASRIDKPVEALGKIDRAKVGRRQSESQPERMERRMEKGTG